MGRSSYPPDSQPANDKIAQGGLRNRQKCILQ